MRFNVYAEGCIRLAEPVPVFVSQANHVARNRFKAHVMREVRMPHHTQIRPEYLSGNWRNGTLTLDQTARVEARHCWSSNPRLIDDNWSNRITKAVG